MLKWELNIQLKLKPKALKSEHIHNYHEALYQMFSVSCCPVQTCFLQLLKSVSSTASYTSEVGSEFPPYFTIYVIRLTCQNTWISMTLSTVFKGTFFTYCKFHLKVTTYHGDAYSKKVHYGHGSLSKVCLLHSWWQTAMRFIWFTSSPLTCCQA